MLSLALTVVSASIGAVIAINSLQGPGGLANPKLLLPMGFKPVSQSANPHFCSVKFFTALILPEEPIHPNFVNIDVTTEPIISGTSGISSDSINSESAQHSNKSPNPSSGQNVDTAGMVGLSEQAANVRGGTSTNTSGRWFMFLLHFACNWPKKTALIRAY